MINKDTQMCISLAKKAGNFGCTIHNAAFKHMGLNFIYKSFSTNDIEKSIDGIRALGIRGAGITMPYKISVLDCVDKISEDVQKIGSSNTIVNDNGVLTAFNTDSFSAYETLKKYSNVNELFILGNGGFSKAVQFSANKLFSSVSVITRKNWKEISDIRDGVIFNCTPVENIVTHNSNTFIDCIISTSSGREISLIQASRQFELYTGTSFPMNYIENNFDQLMRIIP